MRNPLGSNNKKKSLVDKSLMYEDDYESLIYSLIDEGHLQEAIDTAKQATNVYTHSYDLKRCLYNAFLVSEEYDNALGIINDCLMWLPENLELHVDKAHVLIKSKKYSEAKHLIKKLLQEKDIESRKNAFLLFATYYESKGKYGDAFLALKDGLALDSKDIVMIERIWIVTELLGNYHESIDFYNEILSDDPYNYLIWFNLGQAYNCIGDMEDALSAYEYSFIVNENFEFGYIEYIETLIHLKRYEESIRTLRAMEAKFGENIELHINLGKCYFFMDEIEKAIHHFELAKDEDALNDNIYFHLGLCDSANEAYESAKHNFTIAIELNGQKEEYHESLAAIYTYLGATHLAEMTLMEAIEFAPESWSLRYALAKLHFHRDDYTKALNVLTEAEFFHNGSDLLYCEALCMIALGQEYAGKTKISKLLAFHGDADASILYDFYGQHKGPSYIDGIIKGAYNPDIPFLMSLCGTFFVFL